jgi:ribosomal protein S18 acetylase RimI-like enzyme
MSSTRPPAIRTYRSGDGDPLRTIWQDVGFRAIGDDDASLDRFAARNPGLFLVAEDDDGRIVGSTMAGWDGRRGWLYHVAVVAGQRRQGLASALVERAEADLRALGSPRVLVIVEAANTEAMAFWRSRGYEVRDTRHMGRSL